MFSEGGGLHQVVPVTDSVIQFIAECEAAG